MNTKKFKFYFNDVLSDLMKGSYPIVLQRGKMPVAVVIAIYKTLKATK